MLHSFLYQIIDSELASHVHALSYSQDLILGSKSESKALCEIISPYAKSIQSGQGNSAGD